MFQTIPISQAGTTSDRKGIIGGSQVGAVLGLDGYVSQYEVYLAFNGFRQDVTPQTEETFAFGHILEESIAKMFEYKTGFRTVEVPYVYVVPENHNLLIHVDREIVTTDGKRRALECKTVSSYAANKWVDYDNLNDPYIITDLIPDQYLAQVYWYYALGDYDEVYIARITNNKLYTYLVPRPDDETLHDIIEQVKDFYDKLVSGWIPPITAKGRRAQSAKESPDGKSVVADDSTLRLCEELRTIKSDIKDLEEREKEIQGELAGYINDCTWLTMPDGRRLMSYATQTRTTVDSTKLKQEHPDIFNQYSKTSEYRILKFAKSKSA